MYTHALPRRAPRRRLSPALALALPLLLACAPKGDDKPVIGLITKTESNPFFVKMKEGAEQAAAARGATLIAAAGRTDGDNAGQVTAIENLMAAGAKAILISASDSKAIVPAILTAQRFCARPPWAHRIALCLSPLRMTPCRWASTTMSTTSA